MLGIKQCEIARTMTKSTTSDSTINVEFNSMNLSDKITSANEIDALVKMHNLPFDKGFDIMVEDFNTIADKYSISPATLFCVYMESKQPSLEEKLKNAKARSEETENESDSKVEHEPLIKEM